MEHKTVAGEILTPYRRKHLYEKAISFGEDGVDGNIDDGHMLTHALAETSDGPLEVREDYLDENTVPQDTHTSHEIISGWIEFYGTPEQDPDAATTTFTAVVTVKGESTGTADDFEAGLRARLHEFNGGSGSDMVYPEVISIVVTSQVWDGEKITPLTRTVIEAFLHHPDREVWSAAQDLGNALHLWEDDEALAIIRDERARLVPSKREMAAALLSDAEIDGILNAHEEATDAGT